MKRPLPKAESGGREHINRMSGEYQVCASGALAGCLTLAALTCYWALLYCPARLLAFLHSSAAEATVACVGLATSALFVALVLQTVVRPAPRTASSTTQSPGLRAQGEDVLTETAHRATLLLVALLGAALWYLVMALRATPWVPLSTGGI